MRLLIINPGSTSTKVAIFEDGKQTSAETLRHASELIAQYPTVYDQLDFRTGAVTAFLGSCGNPKLDGVVGRGGLLPPMPSGVYEVDDELVEKLRHPMGQHASNLGGLIAKKVAEERGLRAFIADSVTTDELGPLARYSGHPMIPRISIFHALNQKSVARRVAADLGRRYDEVNLIVCHLGGGVSVGAHRAGKVVDVANALDGEGPFAPERAGTLPLTGLVELCYSGRYTHAEARKLLTGGGGFVAHLGTNSGQKLSEMVDAGDEHAALIEKAFVYGVAKEVGRMAVVLEGRVDAIAITGGLAYSARICSLIEERVSPVAKVLRYPGEDEMMALAEAGARALGKVC
ncbi:MAG TPA: butyrate kinase [Bacillota bacterium]|nr:MAG: Butyrate kinase 2 [Firmicutes bacterium ADurb.Bin153]HNV34384.1 butyrate kinase [Bacillota bacterium]